MKKILTITLLLIVLFTNAQTILTPKNNTIEKKWIKNNTYQMAWYALQDTAKFEIGKIITSTIVQHDKVIVVTNVSMQQTGSAWIDSTIANADNLSPVYHSSRNTRRDMMLHFGRIVKGFYNDKIKNVLTNISDTTSEDYFDSNLYPTLIAWMPLKEHYKQQISIYDYSAGSKSGVIKATVHEVKKGIITTKRNGIRNVWIITVSDEIGGGENGFTTYYIDFADRSLWKQHVEAGGRIMEMELVEE